MSRRAEKAAERAAAEASEAARVLQQRGQEAKSEQATEPADHAAAERKPEPSVDSGRMDTLLKNRPHTRAMEELVQSRQASEPQPEPAAEPEPEQKKDEPALEPATEAAATEDDLAEPAEPTLVKAKVDGQEYEVPQEEIDAAGGLKAWQREKAAENRLTKAKEALEETRKVQAQVAEFLMRQAPQGTPNKPEPTDDQFIAERIDKIRFGTPEESAAAMREVLSRGQQKIDPNAIVRQATEEFRHQQAVESFDKEFQDISANPLLLRLAVALRNERIPQLPKGQAVDWSGFYRKIGNEIRAVTGRQSQPTPQSGKTQGNTSLAASDKEARKASIVNLPAGSARAELPKEDKPGTPEEQRKQAIADMRKSRGLSVG